MILRRNFNRCLLKQILFVVFSIYFLSPSLAEVVISGQRGAINIEARNSTLGEIFAAMPSGLGIRYRMADQASRPVSGHYSGSVMKVIPRLLEGLDYVIRSTPDSMEVVVLGPNGSGALAKPLQPERPPVSGTGIPSNAPADKY
jgi:hypothetical protein